MPRRKMSAEVIREVLRLKSQNLSTRQISRSTNGVTTAHCHNSAVSLIITA